MQQIFEEIEQPLLALPTLSLTSPQEQAIPQQTHKRIVSKSEYIVKKTFALGLSGGLIVCGMILALLLLGIPGSMREDEKERRICIAHGFDCAYEPSFVSVA